MLSYQHSFHAGNPADIFKHAILLAVLRHLMMKPRNLSFLDSHAGRGLYDLQSKEALKTAEAESGITKLYNLYPTPEQRPEWVRPLLEHLDYHNPDGNLRYYSGSLLLAARELGDNAFIQACELHPQEVASLKEQFKYYKNVHIHQRDSWEGIQGLTPPKPPQQPLRGAILIDPPYEIKQDYIILPDILLNLSKNWSQAVIMLWYPCIKDQREQSMIKQIRHHFNQMNMPFWHEEAMTKNQGHSLIGSGMIVINPPFGIDAALNQIHQGWQEIYA